MTFDFSSFQPGSPLDFCFPMDSEMNSDFKLDLVEKLFAIDTEPKTPFNTQVVNLEKASLFTFFFLIKLVMNHINTRVFCILIHFIFCFLIRKRRTLIWRCQLHTFPWMMISSCSACPQESLCLVDQSSPLRVLQSTAIPAPPSVRQAVAQLPQHHLWSLQMLLILPPSWQMGNIS